MKSEKHHVPDNWDVSYAIGFFELGMFDDALKQLDKLPQDQQLKGKILNLRCQILLGRKKWLRVVRLSRSGSTLYPDRMEFYIFGALAYFMMDKPLESKLLWFSAPRKIRKSGFFHYNVARCEAKLGNIASARTHMKTAIKLEPELKCILNRDSGLKEQLN
ncbi:MAG TPA: hypothetical protein EYQ50_14840 [Verrucomicrobiales bacterium]|nr:hypothetical protein [Verrucomicrobiales bacterium]HIL70380.1 hypothetical protein [Verrucomicrobiota bacterium]